MASRELSDTVLIPASSFWMGSLPDDPQAHENEKPRRKLSLPAYRIGRYPVTNAQYADFVFATGRAVPEHWDGGNVPDGLAEHPVVNVSYVDAETYCEWLVKSTGEPYRLPTEEEWEGAARGEMPSTCRYPWGEEWKPGSCNTQELGRGGTTAVHEFAQVNRSPFGVEDMAGNVWEWTASKYAPYPGSSYESVHFGIRLVVRGGSWQNSRQQARISCRGRYHLNVRRAYLGLRVALDAEVPAEGEILEELTAEAIDRAKLRQNLVECFSEEELRDLCFDLKVIYDGLPGEGTWAKARELIAHFERRGSLAELLEACQRLRPKFDW